MEIAEQELGALEETHGKHEKAWVGREKNAAVKRTNLNKKKRKRRRGGAEIPTQSKVRQWRKKFPPCESAVVESAEGEKSGMSREQEREGKEGGREEGKSKRGRKRMRKEDSEKKIEVGVEKKA